MSNNKEGNNMGNPSKQTDRDDESQVLSDEDLAKVSGGATIAVIQKSGDDDDTSDLDVERLRRR